MGHEHNIIVMFFADLNLKMVKAVSTVSRGITGCTICVHLNVIFIVLLAVDHNDIL